jgi:phytanoyl-CoA hydroxylase
LPAALSSLWFSQLHALAPLPAPALYSFSNQIQTLSPVQTMPAVLTTPDRISDATVEAFHQRGFTKISSVISKEEAEKYRLAAQALSENASQERHREVFTQLVNVWTEDETMRQLTLNDNLGAVAARLAGVPLRLWHDHLLIKQPHNQARTEFHQDQPYWPHADSPNALSAWIALCDVPEERGCMSFLSGSHRHTDLEAQNLSDGRSLFDKCPELEWEERVTLPLKAGDCTFHHARCAHMATPNRTDDPRIAHVVIFMDATTTYIKKPHVITAPLNLEQGQLIEGDLFPIRG